MAFDVQLPRWKLHVTELPLDVLSHFGILEGKPGVGDVLLVLPLCGALDNKTKVGSNDSVIFFGRH